MLRKILSVALLMVCFSLPVAAEPVPPQLTVRGEAVLEVPADQASLRVGVTAEARSAEEALEKNARVTRTVEAALLEAGLEKGEYSTGNFRVEPVWSTRPRDPEPDWRPEIVGYRVNSGFNLKTRKLELLGRFIEAATRAGANDLGQIGFGLADPRSHRAAAIRAATANALEDAASLAAAAGLMLDGIISLNLDHASVPAPLPVDAVRPMARMMAAEAAPPIVAPEDLEVRASVGVVCRLKPAN